MGNSSNKEKIESIQLEEDQINFEKEQKEKEERKEKLAEIAELVNHNAKAYLARKEWDNLIKTIDRRKNIAKELFATEDSYVKNLGYLSELYYQPLLTFALEAEKKSKRSFAHRKEQKTDLQTIEDSYKKEGPTTSDSERGSHDDLKELINSEIEMIDMPGLTVSAVRLMFSQLQSILNHNKEVHSRMAQVMESWEWTSELGPIFKSLSAFLRVYIDYVNNYSTALDTFNELVANNEPFAKFIQKTNNKKEVLPVGGFEGLLIMPIQRIPRYVLLLEDLLKATPEGHIDRNALQTSLTQVRSVAAEINEKKRGVENFQKLVEIYNRLEPPLEHLCAPHREFIKEGKFQEYDKDIKNFYLFNDMILKTKNKGQKEKVEVEIRLYLTQICDLADDKKIKLKNSFMLTAPTASLILTCKSHEEKKEWIKLIHKNIVIQIQKSQSFHMGPSHLARSESALRMELSHNSNSLDSEKTEVKQGKEEQQ